MENVEDSKAKCSAIFKENYSHEWCFAALTARNLGDQLAACKELNLKLRNSFRFHNGILRHLRNVGHSIINDDCTFSVSFGLFESDGYLFDEFRRFKIVDVKHFFVFTDGTRYCWDIVQDEEKRIELKNYFARQRAGMSCELEYLYHSSSSFLCDKNGCKIESENTAKTITDYFWKHKDRIYDFYHEFEISYRCYLTPPPIAVEVERPMVATVKTDVSENGPKFCQYGHKLSWVLECSDGKTLDELGRNSRLALHQGVQFLFGILKTTPHQLDAVFNTETCEYSLTLWLSRDNRIFQEKDGFRNCIILDVKLFALFENGNLRYSLNEIQDAESKTKYEEYVGRKTGKPYETEYFFHSSSSVLCGDNFNNSVEVGSEEIPRTMTDYLKIHKKNISRLSFEFDITYLLHNNVELPPCIVTNGDSATENSVKSNTDDLENSSPGMVTVINCENVNEKVLKPVTLKETKFRQEKLVFPWKLKYNNLEEFCAYHRNKTTLTRTYDISQAPYGILESIPHEIISCLDIVNFDFTVAFRFSKVKRIFQDKTGFGNCKILDLKLSIFFKPQNLRYFFQDTLKNSELRNNTKFKQMHEHKCISKGSTEKSYDTEYFFHSSCSFLCDNNYSRINKVDDGETPGTVTDYLRIHKKNIQELSFITEITYLADDNDELPNLIQSEKSPQCQTSIRSPPAIKIQTESDSSASAYQTPDRPPPRLTCRTPVKPPPM